MLEFHALRHHLILVVFILNILVDIHVLVFGIHSTVSLSLSIFFLRILIFLIHILAILTLTLIGTLSPISKTKTIFLKTMWFLTRTYLTILIFIIYISRFLNSLRRFMWMISYNSFLILTCTNDRLPNFLTNLFTNTFIFLRPWPLWKFDRSRSNQHLVLNFHTVITTYIK